MATCIDECIRCRDQAAPGLARERRDGALDLARIAHADRAHRDPERWRDRQYGAELTDPRSDSGIAKHRRARHAWCDLLEYFHPFRASCIVIRSKPGGIASRPRKACDKTIGHGIGHL